MATVAPRQQRIGIALSGGTLKATAHIGVLSALESLGIRPHCIAGTSAGAFVAALYAHGYTPNDLIRLIRHFPGPSLFDYGFPFASSLLNTAWYRLAKNREKDDIRLPSGLMRGDKLYRYFRQKFIKRQALLPYYVIATDLLTGNPVVFSNEENSIRSGIAEPVQDVAQCVRGSCSLPGVFTPVKIQGHLLVDGAFRHYVPVEILRKAGCTRIIAVNLYRLQNSWRPETIAHVLSRAYDILLQDSIEGDISGSDLITLKPDVGHLSWVSFKDMESGVEAGRRVVEQHKATIFKVLASDDGRRIPAAVYGRRPNIRIVPVNTKKPPMTGG